MPIPYSNNQEIVIFFNKAQKKIADLGILVANEQEDAYHLRMLLDLSNFLECLESPYNSWLEVDVIRYIHLWNKRADLNNTPYIQLTDYHVFINTGGNSDFGDINAAIQAVLLTFPHNSLFKLQGGSFSERYHLTKAERDWVICQMGKTPCPEMIQPSVSFSITPNGTLWPSGYYELGTSVDVTTLSGVLSLNSGLSVEKYSYERGSTEISSNLNPPNPVTVASYVDNHVLTQDTVYRFKALFEVGGLKEAIQYVQFKQPMFYGVRQRNQVAFTSPFVYTKNVRDVGAMTLSFTLPQGNTLLSPGLDKTAVIVIPRAWGNPTSAKVGVYEYVGDWTFTNTTMYSADGLILFDTITGVFNNSIEGVVEFDFSF